MKRIYLIDCPGIVPPNNNDSAEDILLRGVVRVEAVESPEQYIAAVLKKTKPQHIERTYDVRGFDTPLQFLELLARKGGRLLKGGEADVDGVAKMVLNDFLRGKIPWYTSPPTVEGDSQKGIEGRKGTLGEMRGRMRVESGSAIGQQSNGLTDSSTTDQRSPGGDQHLPANDDENDELDDDNDDGAEEEGDEMEDDEEEGFEGFEERVLGEVGPDVEPFDDEMPNEHESIDNMSET